MDPAAKPWQAKKEWTTNEIRSSITLDAWVLLGMGLLFTLISSPALLELPEELRRENRLILLVLLFPTAGLFMLALSLRRWIQWWRFGKSPLVLSPFPGSIGGQFGGRLVLNAPYDKSQLVSLKLSCIYSFVTRSGNKSTRKEDVRWYQEGYGTVQYEQNNRTAVTFCFDVPEELPESELNKRDFHYWVVQVKTKLKGKPFHRRYRVPVFRTNKGSSIYASHNATEHPANSQRVQNRIAELGLEDTGQTLRMTHPYFRRFGERVSIFLFGSVFMGSGIGVSFIGAPFIFPLVFVPIGFGFMAFAIYALINKYDVSIAYNLIQTQRTLLGIFKTQHSFDRNEIKRFEKSQASVWQGQQGDQKHFYTIKAVPKSGKPHLLIEKLEGKAAADTMVDTLNERFFGR